MEVPVVRFGFIWRHFSLKLFFTRKMDENTVIGDTSYTFLCNGKDIAMRRSTVTAERLGRYFNVSAIDQIVSFLYNVPHF